MNAFMFDTLETCLFYFGIVFVAVGPPLLILWFGLSAMEKRRRDRSRNYFDRYNRP